MWFNGVVKVDGLGASGGSFWFRKGKVLLTINSQVVEVPVPDSVVTYSTSATTATTVFDTNVNVWRTTVPASCSGNVFLAGLALPAGPQGLPKGISPVTWVGEFVAEVQGLSWSSKWAAAVYETFMTDYNAIGVKPVDGNNLSIYQNSDHAGTPKNLGQRSPAARGMVGLQLHGLQQRDRPRAVQVTPAFALRGR